MEWDLFQECLYDTADISQSPIGKTSESPCFTSGNNSSFAHLSLSTFLFCLSFFLVILGWMCAQPGTAPPAKRTRFARFSSSNNRMKARNLRTAAAQRCRCRAGGGSSSQWGLGEVLDPQCHRLAADIVRKCAKLLRFLFCIFNKRREVRKRAGSCLSCGDSCPANVKWEPLLRLQRCRGAPLDRIWPVALTPTSSMPCLSVR